MVVVRGFVCVEARSDENRRVSFQYRILKGFHL